MNHPLVVGWYGPSDGPWEWIQSRFEQTVILDDRSLEDWLTTTPARSESRSKVLLVAMEYRSDATALARIEPYLISAPASSSLVTAKGTKPIPMAIVLGNDWHGHRRTYPLPERMLSFYWYQWYDRIFPWLSEISSRGLKARTATPKRKKAIVSASDTNPWRVQWLMERSQWQASMLKGVGLQGSIAWVLTDHADQRDLWHDACESVGMRVVASRISSDPPWIEPQLVVIDCVSRSEEPDKTIEGEAIEAVIQSIRARHPKALLAFVTSFPTWECWSRWQTLGVDAILPRPAALQGFLFYWHQWIVSQGQTRQGIASETLTT